MTSHGSHQQAQNRKPPADLNSELSRRPQRPLQLHPGLFWLFHLMAWKNPGAPNPNSESEVGSVSSLYVRRSSHFVAISPSRPLCRPAKSIRPTVVAPIWAADNTLVHEDAAVSSGMVGIPKDSSTCQAKPLQYPYTPTPQPLERAQSRSLKSLESFSGRTWREPTYAGLMRAKEDEGGSWRLLI